MRGKDLKNYLAPIQLTPLQKSVLIGSLLGDGSLGLYGKTTGLNLKIEQTGKNKEYVDFLFSIFNNIVGTPPQFYIRSASSLTNTKPSYWFRTYRFDAFTFYGQQFYEIDSLGNRRKCIPKLIHRWLDVQALAIWFQDDGSKSISGYYLHTERYYLFEVKLLQKAIGRNFGLHTNIHSDTKNGKTFYKLYIPAEHKQKFTDIIKSFIIPCMLYKLH